MPRIEPTVGRVVLFHPVDCAAPLAAMIAAVNEDGTINIGYLDSIGTHHSTQFITLAQDGEPVPADGNYCTWMPYQLGQAAKTEEVTATAAKKK